MKSDQFSQRHLGPRQTEISEMLDSIATPKPVEVITVFRPRPRKEKVTVSMKGEVFIVSSSRAEKLLSRMGKKLTISGRMLLNGLMVMMEVLMKEIIIFFMEMLVVEIRIRQQRQRPTQS